MTRLPADATVAAQGCQAVAPMVVPEDSPRLLQVTDSGL